MSSAGPPSTYRDLVKLCARAFYSGDFPPPDEVARQQAEGTTSSTRQDKGSTRGFCAAVLDALTRKEWVKEDSLAEELQLNPKQLRRVLVYLEQQQFIVRYHKRETRRKNQKDAVQQVEELRDEFSAPVKAQLVSYCCIDYALLVDVLQLKLHHLHKRLRAEVEMNQTEARYKCPHPMCSTEYSSFQFTSLFDPATHTFRCEHCKSEVALVLDNKTTGDHQAARKRTESMKALLDAFNTHLKPIQDTLRRLRESGHNPPDFGSCLQWAQTKLARQKQITAAGGGGGGGQRSGTTLTLDGPAGVTMVAVDMEGMPQGEAAPDAGPTKEMPAWFGVSGIERGGGEAGAPDAKPEAAQDKKGAAEATEQDAYEARLAELLQAEETQNESNKRKREDSPVGVKLEEGAGPSGSGAPLRDVAGQPGASATSGAAEPGGEDDWEDTAPAAAAAPPTAPPAAAGDGDNDDWEDA